MDLYDELDQVGDRIIAICQGSDGRDLTKEELSVIAQLEERQLNLRMKINARKAGEMGEKMLNEKMGIKEASTGAKLTATSVFENKQDAYDSGQFLLAALYGHDGAYNYCRSNGLIKNAMKSGNNTSGGFAVPEMLENTLVELREMYGTFRKDAMPYPMSSGTCLVPKVAGEVTSYYMAESDPSNTITSSDMALSQIKLEAKKLATFTPVSSELDEDSVIPIAEMLARSIAWRFAYDEDNAGFNGDGTSTYGSIVGLAGALQAGSKVTATGHATFGALTMGDFENVVGLAKEWAGYQPSWYISKKGFTASMQRLMDALAGNTTRDISQGAPMQFLGYPVKIVQSLPAALTGTTGTPACYFGDLRLGAYLGTRRGINVAVDSSYYFAQDCLAVRATQRFDIVVHDRGDATTAGGLIQLVFG